MVVVVVVVYMCVCVYIYMFYSSELYLSFGGGRSGSVVDPMEKGSAAANQTAIGCLEVGEGRTPLLYARGAAQLLLLLHSISSSLRTTGAKGNKGVAHRTRASGRSHRGLIEEGGRKRRRNIYIYTRPPPFLTKPCGGVSRQSLSIFVNRRQVNLEFAPKELREKGKRKFFIQFSRERRQAEKKTTIPVRVALVGLY